MKRILSLFLSVALILTLTPGMALAFSDAYGSEVWQEDTALHHGVTLRHPHPPQRRTTLRSALQHPGSSHRSAEG